MPLFVDRVWNFMTKFYDKFYGIFYTEMCKSAVDLLIFTSDVLLNQRKNFSQ